MAFIENFNVFFNTNEHAEIAIYTQQGTSTPISINGIFEATFISPLSLVQTENRTFMTIEALIPSAKDGDALVVRGVNYIVREVEHDWDAGIGVVLLHLEG
jgi:hypothetical protein